MATPELSRQTSPQQITAVDLSPQSEDSPARESDLLDSFECDEIDPADLEKAVRSISFLFQWSSESGNKPVEGAIVHSLGTALEKVADDLWRFTRHARRVS